VINAFTRECLKNFAPVRPVSPPEIAAGAPQPPVGQMKVGESSARAWLASLNAPEQGKVLQLFRVEAELLSVAWWKASRICVKLVRSVWL